MRSRRVARSTTSSASICRRCSGRRCAGGLSAGRVQSPALRLIVEREDEITAFKAQEYWTIEALAESAQPERLDAVPRAAVGVRRREGRAVHVHERGRQSAQPSRRSATRRTAELTVAKVDKKQRRRNPAAPFTTSTLQQEASRKLGFSAQRTMTVAQRLYEGIDIGEGTVGLITYMRTDSVTLAEEALRRDAQRSSRSATARTTCPTSRAATRRRRRMRRKRTRRSGRRARRARPTTCAASSTRISTSSTS